MEEDKRVPKLVIHGGCGRFESTRIDFELYHEKLARIIDEGYAFLLQNSAEETVLHVMRLLEDEEIFNAGTGSKLQRDGRARLSAAYMDGRRNAFSAVINIEKVQHPIDFAFLLSGRKHTVIAGEPATRYARREEFPEHDPVTEMRLEEFHEHKKGETGTVGAVALDASGLICAATSTGGIGYEVPGRVGDTPTVAGNYATAQCGVSCTGVGEHIVNQAVAARIATRVEDGVALSEAVTRTISAADSLGYRFGLIALDENGRIEIGQTRKATVLFAAHNGDGSHTFFDRLSE